MNPIFRVPTCLAIAAIFSLSSCATLRSVGKGSVAAVKNSTSATVAKMPTLPKLPDFQLANFLPGNRIKVVEVREKDLKDLPTGKELALAHQHAHQLAHQKQRRKGFWIFGGPVDFQEPTLPEPGSELDGSLLPPRLP